ncbi:MAG: DNA polymerase III subunit delta [Burkholderiaceae bacterium]
MQIKGSGLGALLTRAEREQRLPPVMVIAGDETLLALEAQDAIRATARKLGFSEREVIHADARLDWSHLTNAAQGLSLFAERRIVEVRLPTGKPGVAGAAALETHAAADHTDLLTLVALPKLDRRAREARWVGALERAGVLIDIDTVERAQLPEWIGERLRRQNQTATHEALEFIAERVEGNLLAAHQEIAKLSLLHPAGELSLDQVREAVLDVARFDIFQLPIAMLAGDVARVARSMAGLRAEAAPLPLLLWLISDDLRKLAQVRALVDAGRSCAQAVREARIWGGRERPMEVAAKRVDTESLQKALVRAGEIDRTVKGLRARQTDSDPWLELTDLALTIAQGASAR